LFEMEKYHRNIEGTDIRAVGVMSSRGCPNRCAYCVNAAFRKGILRLRDPIKFVDEIEFLGNKYGLKGFDFWDDTLTISKEHVKRICNEILKRGLDIKWYARARVDTVDKEMLELMWKAGCIKISYGVESGSPRIIKIIRKNINSEQVLKFIHYVTGKMRIFGFNGMILALHEDTDKKMIAELGQFCDKVILSCFCLFV